MTSTPQPRIRTGPRWWILACAALPALSPRGTGPAAEPGREPAPVIVGNDPIGWDQLRPRLAEIAGAQAVEEVALEHQLRDQFAQNGLSLRESDVENEKEIFAQTFRRAAPVGAEPAVERALSQVRRARALGPERFDALLRRSAMLRKLVAPDVRVSEDDVKASLEVRFGPRVRCSIIVVGAESEARRLHDRLSAVPALDLPPRFADEARLLSVDPSGARGGEIDPVSPADPTFAGSFRDAIRDAAPGTLSPVIVFDRGYAVALVQERLPGVEPPPGAEADAREDVRQRAERAEMDRLAGRLLATANITVFDPGLNWSWTGRARPESAR